MKIAFFSSSDFCIPIIDSIYQAEQANLSLLEVFQKQYQELLSLNNQEQFALVLPKTWLDLDLIDNLKKILMDNQELKEILNSKIKLGLIITQPDRFNRTKVIQNPVTKYAFAKQLRIYQPEKVNKELELYNEQMSGVEVAVLASFGQILSQSVLDTPKFGFINWHPSKLPLLRGPTPMQTALALGYETTALSWLEMTKQMDAGEIWLQLEFSLDNKIDINQLANKMGLLGSQTWSFPIIAKVISKTIDKNKNS